MTKDEQVAKILADILDGCPLLYPCSKIWTSEGWCKDHCKPGQQEPDAECWLKYAQAMVDETQEHEDSTESSLTQNGLDTISPQPTCNNLATDTISKRAAIDAIVNTVSEIGLHDNSEVARYGATFRQHEIIDIIEGMPCAQPDGIPLEWIDKHLEWLDNCDNDFAQLAKVSIRAMVEIWKKDKT